MYRVCIIFIVFLTFMNSQCLSLEKCGSNIHLPSYESLYNISGSQFINFNEKCQSDDSNKNETSASSGLTCVNEFPNCTGHYFLNNKLHMWFRVSDGSVELALGYFSEPYWLRIPNDSYCLHDYEQGDNNNDNNNSRLLHHKGNTLLVFCDFDAYKQYKSFREFLGLSSIAGSSIMLPILIVHLILRDKQTVANWLAFDFIFGLSAFQFVLGAIFITHVDILKQDAEFLNYAISMMVAGYFGLQMILSALILNSHMFYTFCVLLVRVRALEQDYTKLRMYNFFIFLGPVVFVASCEITAYYFKKEHTLVHHKQFQYGHESSFPVSFVALKTAFSILIPLSMIIIVATGFVIIYLRCNSKIKCKLQRESFQASLHLFCKLFLGSGIVVGLSNLTVRLMKTKELSWSLVICERVPFLLTSIYFLFAFGITTQNILTIMKKFKIKSFL